MLIKVNHLKVNHSKVNHSKINHAKVNHCCAVNMYLISDYVYNLPDEQIAQHPTDNRDASRLMRMDRKSGKIGHHYFKDIEFILKPDDLIVINNTKVIPARLKGHKESGGKVEVLILDYAGGMLMQKEKGYFQCECMIRASKSPKPDTILFLGSKDSQHIIKAEVKARAESASGAVFIVRFFCGSDFAVQLERTGEIPLPPYIHRDAPVRNLEDRENYQTVYASQKGAVAAPTAGLHFTRPLMQHLEKKGIEFAEITLHVGYGTFVPVRVNDIREHDIHSEFFSISKACADTVNRARAEGRRIIAVGTTSVRTLEYASDDSGYIRNGSGMCDLFIYPGYRFKTVDAVITNFHLPESTLLMLVSAFCGRENILNAYKEAVQQKYRFFSYGDAMFLE